MKSDEILNAMPDPYLPALDTFAFEPDEIKVINAALASAKPWEFEPDGVADAAILHSVKAKVLDLHLKRHGWTCCYCRTNLKGAGPFMTDREHILPKSKPAFKALSYTLWNLAAACKRCNMQLKNAKTSFVVNCDDPTALMSSENYRFVHPNFDDFEQHIIRKGVQIGKNNIVKFMQIKASDKATYTYNFFDLRTLEVDSFDAAQGLENRPQETEAVAAFRELEVSFGL